MSDTTDAMNTEQQPAEQTDDKDMTFCPCCGQKTLHMPVQPNDKLMDQWLACIMTGVPFNHTYPLYDGKVRINVSMLSYDDNRAVINFTNSLDAEYALQGVTDTSTAGRLRTLINMYSSIAWIQLNINGQTQRVEPSILVKQLYDDFMGYRTAAAAKSTGLSIQDKVEYYIKQLTDPKLVTNIPMSIISSVFNAHATINAVMSNAGMDKGFWEGIELA